MNTSTLNDQETLYHKIINYDNKTKIITGAIRFYSNLDSHEYLRYVCFYLFESLKPQHNASTRINDKTYNIFFNLLYDCFKEDEIYEDEENNNMYLAEYSICLDGIDDFSFVIKNLKEESDMMSRMIRITEEQKSALLTVIDILMAFNKIRQLIEAEKPNEFLNRLKHLVEN